MAIMTGDKLWTLVRSNFIGGTGMIAFAKSGAINMTGSKSHFHLYRRIAAPFIIK
jgi:hypothetical protein